MNRSPSLGYYMGISYRSDLRLARSGYRKHPGSPLVHIRGSHAILSYLKSPI